MDKIADLKAEILKIGDLTTVISELIIQGKKAFSGQVSVGISTSQFEQKKGDVEVAVSQINQIISQQLVGQSPDFLTIDPLLENLPIFPFASLPVSIACFKASINQKPMSYPLPSLLFLLAEGAKHKAEESKMQFQEIMVVCQKTAEGKKIFADFENLLKSGHIRYQSGREGAASIEALSDLEILSLMMKILPAKAKLAVDAAALHSSSSMIIDKILQDYPVIILEDPFIPDDILSWSKLTSQDPELLVVGDDITVTNVQRIKDFAQKKLGNGVIIKPDQVKTISQAARALKVAKGLGLKTIVSHRALETMDDYLADFALFFGADFVKFGGPLKNEHLVKYQRLEQIYEQGNFSHH